MINLSNFNCTKNKNTEKESLKVVDMKNKFVRFSRHLIFISYYFREKDNGNLNSNVEKWFAQKAISSEKTWIEFYISDIKLLNKYSSIIIEIKKIYNNNLGDLIITIHPLNFFNLLDNNLINKCHFNYLNLDINMKKNKSLKDIHICVDEIENISYQLNFRKLILNLYNISPYNLEYIPKFIDKILEKMGNNIIDVIKIPFFLCWRKEKNNDELHLIDKVTICELKKSLDVRNIPITFNWFTNYSYCAAEHWNQYLLDSKGYLYQCFNDFHKDNKIGKIINEGNEERNISLIYNFLSNNPMELVECKNCELLDCCYGGCKKKKLAICFNNEKK